MGGLGRLNSDIICCVGGGLDWFWDNDRCGGDERKLAFSILVDIADLAGALVADEEGMLGASRLEGC